MRWRGADLCRIGRGTIIRVMSAPLLCLRWLTPFAFGLAACTAEGTDVATTFGDPMSMSGNGSGSGSDASAGTTDESEGPPPATDDSGPPPDPTTGPGTTDDTSDPSDSSGSPPPDEQPASGMYSECARQTDCIGQTICVVVLGAESGFCSTDPCTDAPMQCQPNPGATSTATPSCVMDTAGNSVCALLCSGGLTCPGGMECLELGAEQVCV